MIRHGATKLSDRRGVMLLMGLLFTVAFLVFPQPGGAAAPEGIACTPEPTDMTISYGDLITCQIDPIGDTDVFRFLGSAGDTVSIQVVPISGGPKCFDLFDPEGIYVSGICLNGNRIDAHLTKTGTHTIRVIKYQDNATMTYRLSLERLSPPSPSARVIHYGENLDDEINPPGDVDLFRFEGIAGDTVSIQVVPISGGPKCFDLFDPEGIYVSGICLNGNRIDAHLTKTGTHTIRVIKYQDNATMTYLVNVQCIGQCPSLPFPTIAITLTGCTTCMAGNVFTATAVVANPLTRKLEAKLGLYLPDQTPVNLAGNPFLVLPPGFTFNGQVFQITLPGGLPQGIYNFCGLLLELELGEPVAKSCQTFTIGP